LARYRVLIDANDEKGLVYKISKVFFDKNLNIVSNNEFVDKINNKFFMRSVVDGNIQKDSLLDALNKILPKKPHVKIIQPDKNKEV